MVAQIEVASGGKPRRGRGWWIAGTAVLGVGYLCLVPAGTYRTTYRAVDDAAGDPGNVLIRIEKPEAGKPQYLLSSENLYLETDRQRHGLILPLMRYQFFTRWNKESIASFRKEYPEFERYWPSQEQENGGVAWVP